MSNRVLVTGADGFIGSHLTEELVKSGEKVTAFCLYNSFGTLGWIDTLPKEIRSEIEIFTGDVRDPNGVRTAMRGQQRVFHLAALIAIPFSYHSPDSYVDTNIKGTLNMCQASLDAGVSRLLVTSTSEVYGTAKYIPIDEEHPRQPQSPYSATKIGADAIAKSFYNAFGLPVAIVRPFNTYGPRQSARAIIPTIISQIANGAREIKVGDLTPTRDFNYVRDTVRGFAAIAAADGVEGEEINIATNTEVSMAETLQTIADIMAADVKWVTDPQRLRPAKSEVFRLHGANDKIRRLTGWQPEYSLRSGLEKTVEWFLNPDNLKMYKSDIYNR